MIRYEVATKPEYEPAGVDEVRSHLRIDTTDEDAQILQWIKAARSRLEHLCGRFFITQTIDWFLDDFPSLSDTIWVFGPVQSITSIKYQDQSDTEQTLASSVYELDSKGFNPRIRPTFNEVWPSTYDTVNAVTIRYVAGYGNPVDVPKEITLALKMLVGHYYENRESTAEANIVTVPQGVYDLISDYRVWLKR